MSAQDICQHAGCGHLRREHDDAGSCIAEWSRGGTVRCDCEGFLGPVEAPADCDGGHPGCSVCDAAEAEPDSGRETGRRGSGETDDRPHALVMLVEQVAGEIEATNISDADLAEVLRLAPATGWSEERMGFLALAGHLAPRMARELIALRAEVERLRAVEAGKVADVDRVLAKHAAAVGVVGPMPGAADALRAAARRMVNEPHSAEAFEALRVVLEGGAK